MIFTKSCPRNVSKISIYKLFSMINSSFILSNIFCKEQAVSISNIRWFLVGRLNQYLTVSWRSFSDCYRNMHSKKINNVDQFNQLAITIVELKEQWFLKNSWFLSIGNLYLSIINNQHINPFHEINCVWNNCMVLLFLGLHIKDNSF